MPLATKLIQFDWFIKKMFRNKSDYCVLEGFLTALLKKDVVIIKILESESNQDTEKQKYNRVDILVELDGEERVVIEVQNERESDYLERVLFGTSKIITDYFEVGMDYEKIVKVISVSILYFNLGKGTDYVYHGKNKIYGIHNGEELLIKEKAFLEDGTIKFIPKRDIFPEYYFINVNKFSDITENELDEWIYFLKNSDIKKEFKSKYIQECAKRLNINKLSDEERKEYERHLKNLIIEKDVITTAKKEGLEQGFEQGLEEGIEQGIEQGIKQGIERGVVIGLYTLLVAKKITLSFSQDELINKLCPLGLEKISLIYERSILIRNENEFLIILKDLDI